MFSRSRAGRRARADRTRRDPAPASPLAREAGEVDSGDVESGAAEPEAPVAAEAAGPGGPYDASEAPVGARRLDLGSLRIPMVAGVEVRVQPGKDGAVQRVFLLHAKSTVELGVLAAPRSEPIWDEVRTDIRRSLSDDGVAVEETGGPYGTELRARVRTKDGVTDLRFLGVDGPRWMVSAVYRGPAAVDPAKAGPLAECLRGLVVDRGNEARPVKERLPLRLPEDLVAKLPEGAQGVRVAGGPPAGTAGGRPASSGALPPGSASITATGSSGTRGSGGSGTAVTGAPRRRKPPPRPRRRGTGTGSTGA
jgi:hypothetical protein